MTGRDDLDLVDTDDLIATIVGWLYVLAALAGCLLSWALVLLAVRLTWLAWT